MLPGPEYHQFSMQVVNNTFIVTEKKQGKARLPSFPTLTNVNILEYNKITNVTMKKRSHFFITFPIILVLAGTLFFLFLPYLLDLYLFPRLIADLPFATKELSLSRLSPWKIRGTLTLADQDRPTLAVPRFEISYTPGSLLKREIAALLLDSASLQIDIRDGQPILRGLSARLLSHPGGKYSRIYSATGS